MDELLRQLMLDLLAPFTALYALETDENKRIFYKQIVSLLEDFKLQEKNHKDIAKLISWEQALINSRSDYP